MVRREAENGSGGSEGDDLDGLALGHRVHGERVAGQHGDLVRGSDSGTDMSIGDGNPGSAPDGRRGIGVARVERDIGYPQPVDERPGRRRAVPAGLDPDGGGHRDTYRERPRLTAHGHLGVADGTVVVWVGWAGEGL